LQKLQESGTDVHIESSIAITAIQKSQLQLWIWIYFLKT
jgi:hypothetical protein